MAILLVPRSLPPNHLPSMHRVTLSMKTRDLTATSRFDTKSFRYKPGAGGGGGTPLNELYKYVPPHRVGFLHRFGLKTGIHFAHFGLESSVVFEGTAGVYERFYRFNSK